MRSFLRLSSIALTPVLALLFGVACGQVALAQQATAPPSPTPPPTEQSNVLGNEYDGKWHTDVTPYIWVPTLNGTFHLTNTSKPPPGFQIEKIVDFSAGPNKYLSKLNSALMFTAEFRKGDSAFFTDFMYLNLTSLRIDHIDYRTKWKRHDTADGLREFARHGYGLDSRDKPIARARSDLERRGGAWISLHQLVGCYRLDARRTAGAFPAVGKRLTIHQRVCADHRTARETRTGRALVRSILRGLRVRQCHRDVSIHSGSRIRVAQ